MAHLGSRVPPDPLAGLIDVFARSCPCRELLQAVTGKWSVLSLVALKEHPYRFNALRRRVDGVSEKMLSQTLQQLEGAGLVHREVLAAIPAKVEYSLTDAGLRVATPLVQLLSTLEAEVGARS